MIPGLGAAVAYVRRKGSADYLRLGLEARGAGRFTGTLPSLLASDGDWDVEYYVEGHDGSGAVAGRAGDAGGAAALPARGDGDRDRPGEPVALVPVDGARRSSPPARRRRASTS